MAERIDEFRARGIDVIAVSMSRPDILAPYLSVRPLPFPMVCDPDRRVYAALGLGRTSWLRLFRPGIVWRYLAMIARGARVRRVPEGEDALQLGGDFLVDRDGRVRWAHRSEDPTGRPPIEQLLTLTSGSGH